MVGVLLVASNARAAAYNWDNGEPGDTYWSSPNNWEPNGVPSTFADTAEVAADLGEANMPVIPSAQGGKVGSLTVSSGIYQSHPTRLTVEGSLTCNENMFIGSWFRTAQGTLVIKPGGVVNHTGNPGRIWVGYKNRGELFMEGDAENGGTFLVNQLELARGDDCPYYEGQNPAIPGEAYAYLDGGEIVVDEFFTMRMGYPDCGGAGAVSWPQSKGHMDVNDGILRIAGDARDQLGQYVADGWITAFGRPNDPNNPVDPETWYQPGNDINNFWMPKKATLFIDYDMRNDDETTLSAYLPGNGEAYNPKPLYGEQGAAIGLTPTLSWTPGDYVAPYDPCQAAKTGDGHHVFFHTKKSYIDNAVINYGIGTNFGHLVGAQGPNSISPAQYFLGGLLALDTVYYWCVIEVNDATKWKSATWALGTVGGSAGNPVPGDGVTLEYYLYEDIDVNLMWSRGYFAADMNGHDVYFGTNWDDVNDANTDTHWGTYMGRQTDQLYPLTDLKLGTTYSWRIDEVNLAHPDQIWKGNVWSFTVGPYRIIDDFDGGIGNWDEHYYPADCGISGTGGDIYADRGMLQFVYESNGGYWGYDFFSETRYVYDEVNYPDGADWTQGDSSQTAKALGLLFMGLADNNTDPNYDRMYVAIEDTAGEVAILLHEDPNAQTYTAWQQWDIDLREFSNAVDLNAVRYFYLGLGVRCNPFAGTPGGLGTVWYDDLRLYVARCIGTPGYRQPGDLSGNCFVDSEDLGQMFTGWQLSDLLVTGAAPSTDGLIVHYNFDEVSGSTATDSSSNGLNGTALYTYYDANFVPEGFRTLDPCDVATCPDPCNPNCDPNNPCCPCDPNYDEVNNICCPGHPEYVEGNPYCDPNYPNEPNVHTVYVADGWDPCGINGGCIDLAGAFEGANEVNYAVTVPNDIYDVIDQQISVALWINAPENYLMATVWAPLFTNDTGTLTAWCPTPSPPTFDFPDDVHFICGEADPDTFNCTITWGNSGPDDFIGWNHYAFVKDSDANYMRIYHDGDLEAESDSSHKPYPVGDANNFLIAAGVTTYSSDQHWKGKIDDFRMYGRILSHGEVAHLAGYSELYYPLVSQANIYDEESRGSKWVNFKDLALLADDWMKGDLWPLGTSP